MSWGYKILIVYCVFIAGIAIMVVSSSRIKSDLVTPDYYAQELKYQTKIDEARRTDKLSSSPGIVIQKDQLTVHFPKEFLQQSIKGIALLYCPADEKEDIKKDFTTIDATVVLTIPAVHKSLYQLQLSWEVDGINYYYEKKIKL